MKRARALKSWCRSSASALVADGRRAEGSVASSGRGAGLGLAQQRRGVSKGRRSAGERARRRHAAQPWGREVLVGRQQCVSS